MATRLLHKRGNKADLQTLADGQLGLAVDTNELFIGNSGNKKVANLDAFGNPVHYNSTGTLTGATTSTSPVEIGSIGLTTVGNPVRVGLRADGGDINDGSVLRLINTGNMVIRLLRDGSVLANFRYGIYSVFTDLMIPVSSVFHEDLECPAGAHTFSVTLHSWNGQQVLVENFKLYALEYGRRLIRLIFDFIIRLRLLSYSKYSTLNRTTNPDVPTTNACAGRVPCKHRRSFSLECA